MFIALVYFPSLLLFPLFSLCISLVVLACCHGSYKKICFSRVFFYFVFVFKGIFFI